MAGGIFISYRRDDASHVAGRMADAFGARVGRENVFVDVDSVAPGEDFVRKIEATIKASDIFLAVIGSNWLKAPGPDGQRRIDLPGDFIRLEVKSALAAGLRIIPVLVDGAGMPREEELPEDIRQLVRHNAVFVSHATFARDMSALLEQIAPEKKNAAPKLNMLALPLGAGVLLLGMLAIALWPKGAPPLTSSVSLAEEKAGGPQQFILETRFKAERGSDGRLSIRAALPYRDRMREERRIDGLEFEGAPPILPGMPMLNVLVTNGQQTPVTINEVQFEVVKAERDQSALPVLREFQGDYQTVMLVNDGWGEMEKPQLTVKAWGIPADRRKSMTTWKGEIISDEPCADPFGPVEITPLVVQGTPNARGAAFDLSGQIPEIFSRDIFVCAVGELSYSSGGKQETLAIRTRVSNRRPDYITAAPVSEFYDLYLDPDREGYVAVVPLLRPVAAGATDTIPIRVYSDKSATFELRQKVRTSTGEVISGEALNLEVFAPRYIDMPYRQAPGVLVLIPQDDLRAIDKAGLIESGVLDPQGVQGMTLLLNGNADDATCTKVRDELGPAILKRLGAREMAVTASGADGACAS